MASTRDREHDDASELRMLATLPAALAPLLECYLEGSQSLCNVAHFPQDKRLGALHLFDGLRNLFALG